MLLVIKGKDEDRKFQRQCYYNIAAMFVKNMPPVEQWLPVAYENERLKADIDADLELYKAAVSNFDNIIWSKS